MLVPFHELPGSARVWIYQSNRLLSGFEVEKAATATAAFCQGWQAHGVPLRTSFQILHGLFLALAADEHHHSPSGCSIDSSVAFVKSLESSLGTVFFDRTTSVYLDAAGSPFLLPLPLVKDAVASGKLTPDTTVFNNLVQTKADMEKQWKTAAADTWLKRYFKTEKTT